MKMDCISHAQLGTELSKRGCGAEIILRRIHFVAGIELCHYFGPPAMCLQYVTGANFSYAIGPDKLLVRAT